MYNTGDLGRLREDGHIEPLGRLDDQVKIKVSWFRFISDQLEYLISNRGIPC